MHTAGSYLLIALCILPWATCLHLHMKTEMESHELATDEASRVMPSVPSVICPNPPKGASCKKCKSNQVEPCTIRTSVSMVTAVKQAVDRGMSFAQINDNRALTLTDGGFYVFVRNMDTMTLMVFGKDPAKVKLGTKTSYGEQGATQYDELHKRFNAAAKVGGGWVDYKWRNKGEKEAYPKMSFIQYIPGGSSPGNYYAGVGFVRSYLPLDPKCSVGVASRCAETNVLSLCGRAIEPVLLGSDDSNVQEAFRSITKKKKYRSGSFYVFIYDYATEKNVAFGGHANDVGLTMSQICKKNRNTAISGTALHKSFVAAANGGGGWVSYPWTTDGGSSVYFKVSYVLKIIAYGKNYYLGGGYKNICGQSGIYGNGCPPDSPPVCVTMLA